jgi:ParB family chromosome partitioning protein
MSRLDKMMAKTQGIRAAKDIPASEAPPPAGPRTAVGTMAAWQAAQRRIEELEAQGSSSMVSIEAIKPNPWQPRRVFKDDEIRKLADSIVEVGLIQPIAVRRVQNLDTGFELVAGERRLRAHRLLGLPEIKAVIIQVADEDMAAMALAENIDREDLSAYEIAIAVKNAEAAFPSRKELAKSLGMQRSDLYRYLAFFQLPAFIREDLDANPAMLGRDAAEALVGVLKKHGDKATESVSRIWTRFKAGEIEQGKLAATIDGLATRGPTARSDRDIKKLFIGKAQAGSITRDAGAVTVKIRAGALSPEKEIRLRVFVQDLLLEAD